MINLPLLTAIIPLDLKTRKIDIINRAVRFAKHAEKNNYSIVFGHNDRKTIWDNYLKKRLSKFKNVLLNSVHQNSNNINTSSLRNHAFAKVTTKYLLIIDVDIFPDETLLNKYVNKLVEDDNNHFYILPCLYLTKYGSSLLCSKKDSIESIKNRYFSFSRKEFLHLASPSSITIMKSSSYYHMNGFDEKYNGHGYEDFDFLLRLGKHHQKIKENQDLLSKDNSRSPLFAIGFKKHIGRLCLEALIEKDIFFHIYHKKEKNDKYYQSRKNNYEYFSKKFGSGFTETPIHSPDLINEFITICISRGLEPSNYSIIFENKPGHIDRYETISKKIRFLIK